MGEQGEGIDGDAGRSTRMSRQYEYLDRPTFFYYELLDPQLHLLAFPIICLLCWVLEQGKTGNIKVSPGWLSFYYEFLDPQSHLLASPIFCPLWWVLEQAMAGNIKVSSGLL